MIFDKNKYMEIAEYLKAFDVVTELNQIDKIKENSNYILSFMGQFSAGKSKLINNILDRNILPVHITETTPIITFLSYGKEEYAVLNYKNGITENIAVEKVKDIWQSSNEFKNMEGLEYIDIYLDCEILKKGLIIADTPGVNTIIQKHKELTNALLESTQEIMYVMAKPLTNSDAIFLRKISSLGKKVSFIYTHMDEIIDIEEDVNETILQNKNIIKDNVEIDNFDMYFVSNEKDNKWYMEINKIKNYLLSEFSKSMIIKIDNYCKDRIALIQMNLLGKLETKLEQLESVEKESLDKLMQDKEILDKDILAVKEMLARRESKIDTTIARVKEEAMDNMMLTSKKVQAKGKSEINKWEYSEDYEDKFIKLGMNMVNKAYSKLQDSYIESFDELIKGSNDDLIEELKEINSKNMSLIADIPLPNDITDVLSIKSENEYNLEKLKFEFEELQKAIEEREEDIRISKEAMKDQGQTEEFLEDMKRLDDELKELGEYIPQYVEVDDGKKKMSEKMRTLGSMLDIATFFIPSGAYTILLTNAAKSINKVKKAVDLTKTATKAGSTLSKVDKVKDTIYSVKNIWSKVSNTRASKKRTQQLENYLTETSEKIKNKFSIFDMFTFEYWLEKGGKMLDKPAKMEIDKEYENLYKSRYNEIKDKQNMIRQRDLEEKQKLGLLSTEIKRKEEEQRWAQKKEKEIQERMKKEEEEIKKNAIRNVFIKYKEDYIQWYTDKVEDMCDDIVENVNEYMIQVIECYKKYCTATITEELDKLKQSQEELIECISRGGEEEIKMEVLKCKRFVEVVGE